MRACIRGNDPWNASGNPGFLGRGRRILLVHGRLGERRTSAPRPRLCSPCRGDNNRISDLFHFKDVNRETFGPVRKASGPQVQLVSIRKAEHHEKRSLRGG